MLSKLSTVAALAALAIMPAAAQAPAAAPVKMGIINVQQALSETAEIKKAQAALQSKYKPQQDRLAAIQKELADIQNQLQTGGDKLAPQKASELQVTGQRRQRELERLREDLEGEFQREQQEILGRTGQKMQDAIKRVAEARGLDVVVDMQNTIYVKPALDITKEVVADYDKTNPVK